MRPLGVLKKPVAAPDPNLTLALLHFEGTNGSTTFTDSSPFFRNFAARFGTPTLSTAQSKFGGASLSLGGGSSIRALDNPNLELADSDFTFEFWVRPTAVPNDVYLVSRWEGGNFAYQIYTNQSGKLCFYFSTDINSGVFSTGGTSPLTLNTWTHIAVVRSGSTLKSYVNGVLDGSTIISGSCLDGTSRLIIGTWPNGGSGLNGYIDEFRIRKEAMYLANFTPPIAPFTF